MKLHCDKCDRVLGDNIMDIRAEGHWVAGYNPGQISLPDMECKDCFKKLRPASPLPLVTAPTNSKEASTKGGEKTDE